MAEKDSVTKSFMQDNEVFRDFMNMFFKMHNVDYKIESLDDVLTESDSEIAIANKSDKTDAVQKMRDVLKRVVTKKDDVAYYSILGVENQTNPNSIMLIRNMVYDSINYLNQGLKDKDNIVPVVTVALYWDKNEKNPKISLKDFMNPDHPLINFISDYQMWYLNVRDIPLDVIKALPDGELKRVLLIMYSERKNDDTLLKDIANIKLRMECSVGLLRRFCNYEFEEIREGGFIMSNYEKMIRRELEPKLREELEPKLRKEIRNEVRDEVRNEVQDEVRNKTKIEDAIIMLDLGIPIETVSIVAEMSVERLNFEREKASNSTNTYSGLQNEFCSIK